MKALNTDKIRVWLLAGIGIPLVFQTVALAAGDLEGTTAVASAVSNDYIRAKNSDGSFQPEYYGFGEGGNWGGDISDSTIDKLRFIDVARVIAEPLASQRYFPARNPNKTRLLVMVYWGTTVVPERPDMDPQYSEYNQLLEEYRLLMEEGQPNEANAVLTSALHILSSANHQRTISISGTRRCWDMTLPD